MLQVNSKISIPLREIKFAFSRASGPGGQHVNKVNSRVQLRWNVYQTAHLPEAVKQRFVQKFAGRLTGDGDLIIASQRFRDQSRNVDDSLNKLREMILAVATPPRPRKATQVSKGAKRRRRDEKKRQSQKKQLRKPIDD